MSTVEKKTPSVIWLTGLSGAGKTTLAERLCERLAEKGIPFEHLDGDRIRDVFPSTGFTRDERDRHVRRVGFMAATLERHGVTVVASLISPYRNSRDFVRGQCQNFVEVHVDAPVDVCEGRDVKGLYAKARRGEIENFTGVNDPYEAPIAADLVLETDHLTIESAVSRLEEFINKRKLR